MGGSQQRDDRSGFETVGQAIRLGREARSISRDDLANRLRMGCEQLEALENGELQRLPEPVFVKAMVGAWRAIYGLMPMPSWMRWGISINQRHGPLGCHRFAHHRLARPPCSNPRPSSPGWACC